jgi:hypothetical protein
MACDDDFLKPNALSFYTPENTLIDQQGMEGLLLPLRKRIRNQLIGEHLARGEYFATDISQYSHTYEIKDLTQKILPQNPYGQTYTWDYGY